MARGRRNPPNLPGITSQPWEQARRSVFENLEYAREAYDGLPAPHADTHLPSGPDPLETEAPNTLALGNVTGPAAVGDSEAFARADHDHGPIKRDVRVKKAGADVATRNAVNFIDGTGVAITVADDAVNDEVDVTVSAAAAVASAQDEAELFAFFVGG